MNIFITCSVASAIRISCLDSYIPLTMHICTITCHDVYNYGASLQAFALQQYLVDAGHETEIIDYKPDYLSAKYCLSWYVNESSHHYERCRKSFVAHAAYAVLRLLGERRTIGRRLSFHSFNRKYLRLTRRYDSYRQLCKAAPEADVYIVGSDQVWNNAPLDNGWDPAFYLRFGDGGTRRISYAASLGSTRELPWIVREWLHTLDAVSIREGKSLPLLLEAGLRPQVVCDPVFLLSAAQWREKLCLKRPGGKPYVAVYDLSGGNERLLADAKALAKALGAEVHYIVTQHKAVGMRNVVNADPRRFVSEIAGAEWVLADSFHAAAFAIIFGRNFYSYTFSTAKASERITNLLATCGLSARFAPTCVSAADTIDFAPVREAMARYIDESKQWLAEQTNNKVND